MTNPHELEEAITAYKKGDYPLARKWVISAALKYPGNDLVWILLAAISPPSYAGTYLSKALLINPQNKIAQKGLAWVNKKNEGLQREKTPPMYDQTVKEVQERKTSLAGSLVKKAFSSFLILLAIALITLFMLQVSELGRLRIPLEWKSVMQTVAFQFYAFLFHHPQTYIWKKEVIPALQLVSQLFVNSAGLLLVSIFIASFFGGILGLLAAQIKKRNIASLTIFISILGVSLPSFLFAMLFWILDIRLFRWFGLHTAPFPPTGFGWDLHLVMPAVVLAARPLAQIMQITYIHTTNILSEDFIRTAKAKGLKNRLIINRHVFRNILIPYLTTIANSLRFSLASLPVVESFFLWPGIGLSILNAINANNTFLATDLILMLGLFFLIVNNGLDFLYPIIDPRIRSYASEVKLENQTRHTQWKAIREAITSFWIDIKATIALRLNRNKSPLAQPEIGGSSHQADSPRISQDPILFKSDTKKILTNVPLLLGSVLVVGFIILILFGPRFIDANPYQTNGIMMIEGIIHAPPFEPSNTFPWGSDLVGRDIQALVIYGASQTLVLAFLATIARLIFGSLLGLISGWWLNSWFDRFIKSLTSIWAAFPETIFALLIILALGIQKGRSVFIIAFCLVGWGEIAQLVRAFVINIKPSLFIESARSIGSRSRQLLVRHVFPHLLPSLLVIFALQMGGILLLLAELGFLNIFLGGGFKVNIAETSNMSPVIFYFSDIPEWGSLLSNIRDWWRSYPWLAWYPGIFFFLSIFTFNLWGEGIRRLIQETHINLNRLINRYTISALIIVALIISSIVRTTSPIDIYAKQAQQFDTKNALAIIEELSSDKYQGRRSDTISARKAADYIAEQMERAGLFPAASNTEYIQQFTQAYLVLDSEPNLVIKSPQFKDQIGDLTYKKDFSELGTFAAAEGTYSKNVVGVVLGQGSSSYQQKSNRDSDISLADKIVIIRQKDLEKIRFTNISGLLVIADSEQEIQKKYLFTNSSSRSVGYPVLQVTPELGESLLQTCGSSGSAMDLLEATTPIDQLGMTENGAEVFMSVIIRNSDSNQQFNVMGYIPGSGSNQQGEGNVRSADQNVIVISAYYDGLGTSPDGTIYSGANDNASGVAAMLEIARQLKNSPYPPEKTVLFVAWEAGERQRGLSISNVTEASRLFSNSKLEAILELTGVGGGTGKAISLDSGTSYRLITLFQKAAAKFDTKVTTRGRNPHTGLTITPGFGERTALSAYISWDGSDQYAHLTSDTFDKIDPEKLTMTGKTTLLVVTILSRESDY